MVQWVKASAAKPDDLMLLYLLTNPGSKFYFTLGVSQRAVASLAQEVEPWRHVIFLN